MNNNYKKKCFAIILFIAIVLTGVTGCKKDTKSMNTSEKAMGRFVETEYKMPQNAADEYFFQMELSDNGYPTLYSCNKDSNKKGVYKYILKKDGSWEKSDIAWLKNTTVFIPSQSNLIFGVNGEQYFYNGEDIDGYLHNHLIKAVSETSGKEIQLEGWEDKKSPYAVPSSIQIAKNGNIICNYSGSIVIYDKDTYKKTATSTINRAALPRMTKCGEKYVFFTGNNYEPDSISLYNSDFKFLKEIPFETPRIHENYNMYASNDNSIIMCNTDGIHRLKPNTTLWETIIDGSMSSLSLSSLFCTDMIQTPSDEYYILYIEAASDNFKLMKYDYDANTASNQSIELSVYSLKNNNFIQEAIHIFQNSHPDVKINVRIAMDENSTANKTDYIKALNTELLSKNGADLLLLDDLPASSFIEKGVLTDISKTIQPMIDSGELLPNIINNYKIQDKFYSVPTRYSLPILYGYKNVVNASTTLDSIANYVKSNPDTRLFGKLSYSDLIAQFLPMDINSLCDKKGVLNKKSLVEFLEKIKLIIDSTNCVSEYGKDSGKPNSYYLASSNEVAMENTKCLFDFCLPNSITNYIKGTFASYDNSFSPIGEIGINSSSKHIDLCEEFIETLLSTQIQNKIFYEGGFPVNSKSLETFRTSVDDSYRAETEIENAAGSYSPLIIRWPNKDSLVKLTNICKKAYNKTVNNEVLFNMITKEALNYFNGTMTAEEAADAIIARSNIYLSE